MNNQSRMLSALACFLWLAGPLCFAAETVETKGRAVEGGMALEWRLGLTPDVTGETASGQLQIELKDANTNAPVPMRRPAAWMSARLNALVEEQGGCKDQVRAFAGAGIGRRAEIDLNTYRIVTLNEDGTVTFINPFAGVGKTKLESIVELKTAPIAWQLSAKRRALYVLLPDKLVVINTTSRSIDKTINLAQIPASNLMVDEATDSLWIGANQGTSLLHISLADYSSNFVAIQQSAQKIIRVGAVVAAADFSSGLINILGAQDKKNQRVINLATRISDMAWSEQAQRLLISTHAGKMLVVDPLSDTKEYAEINLDGGADKLVAVGEGRWMLAHSMGTKKLHLIDMSSNLVTRSSSIDLAATEISATNEFVYLHNPLAARMAIVPITELRKGSINATQIAVGTPERDMKQQAAPSKLLAQAPEANGVLVGNAQDGTVYRYVEGMMAPVGSFSNYRRRALGVVVLNNGFEQIEANKFTAPVRIESGGRYQLVIASLQPNLSVCAPVNIDGIVQKQKNKPNPIQITLLQTKRGQMDYQVRVQLKDANNQPLSGIHDLRLLAYERASTWQNRIAMQEQDEPGIYAASFANAPKGVLEFMVSSNSHSLSFVNGRVGSVTDETNE